MSADILLYALIAAGLVFWLKNILGTRNDEDEDHDQARQNRINIFTEKEENSSDMSISPAKKPDSRRGDNVVSLDAIVGRPTNLPRHVRIDNKTTENALEDIARDYPDFDLRHFVSGAQDAFSIIIEAFAEGDLDTLKDLLAPQVYEAFAGAIEKRKEHGETVFTEVKSIEKVDIVDTVIKDNIFYITVRFTAREICVIRDAQGEAISGDPQKITQMVDIWVFGRDMKAEGPEWYLYETRDDEIEDHKTPIPESGKDKNK